MEQHVSLEIQHKDVRLSLLPAAAGDTKVGKGRFPFCVDQLRCVVYQSDEFAGLLMFVRLIEILPLRITTN